MVSESGNVGPSSKQAPIQSTPALQKKKIIIIIIIISA